MLECGLNIFLKNIKSWAPQQQQQQRSLIGLGCKKGKTQKWAKKDSFFNESALNLEHRFWAPLVCLCVCVCAYAPHKSPHFALDTLFSLSPFALIYEHKRLMMAFAAAAGEEQKAHNQL